MMAQFQTFQATSRSNTNLLQDPSSCYYLHPSETPGIALTTTPLTTLNYHTWSKSVWICLKSKNKIRFIDGTLLQRMTLQHVCTIVATWIIESRNFAEYCGATMDTNCGRTSNIDFMRAIYFGLLSLRKICSAQSKVKESHTRLAKAVSNLSILEVKKANSGPIMSEEEEEGVVKVAKVLLEELPNFALIMENKVT
ncbi:uncharacterized protein LOC110273108 [Arachis duranensis]|uniref:Uncharacterized protein LOC110273108 n=1 Tax=Arachis duranensis TaxID=130453 RepID=A0A9C6TEK8_ARADU|nr:uncharacterized protein LOC110273108 [Arachis duranensis]XP_052107323.1 uncharacterized protein LOC110273108 [Arachis duranensis]